MFKAYQKGQNERNVENKLKHTSGSRLFLNERINQENFE